MNWLKKIFNTNDKNVASYSKAGKGNVLFIDLGASSVKACDENGNCVNFKSTVREISNQFEVTTQINIVNVNGTYYAVDENKVSTSKELLKHKKKNFEVLIMYAIKMLNINSSDITIYLLLPFDQLCYKSEFDKVLNQKFIVDGKRITLHIESIYPEGEMSYYLIKKTYNVNNKNVVVMNIGYSTIDILVLNKNGGREGKPRSIPMGTRLLMPEHCSPVSVRSGAKLSSLVADGFVYPTESRQAVKEANYEFINEFMSDAYFSIFTGINPQNTDCFLCGGGCNLIGADIKDWIKAEDLIKDFSIKVLTGNAALYTDLLGMYHYVKERKPNIVEYVAVDKEHLLNENVVENDIVISDNKSTTEVLKENIVKDDVVVSDNKSVTDVINNKITTVNFKKPVVKTTTSKRVDYDVLIPKILNRYTEGDKVTIAQIENEFNISFNQARKAKKLLDEYFQEQKKVLTKQY
ncbi:MAG: ParM/StbA family protein [Filifactoraceae bacterium]